MDKVERLQKIIASRGYASRRQAEVLISQGKVKVNGVKVTELGLKFPLDVEITINGKNIKAVEEAKVYYLFYKPRAVISTLYDPQGRKTVKDYFKKVPERVYPVGRLDYDVSGLLIMTNDGEFANFVMHPRYEFKKTYQGLVEGIINKKQVKQLVDGVIIDDNYRTKAIDAQLIEVNHQKNYSIIELTIAEGRKHHVKKMFEAANLPLMKLMRTKLETLELGNLKSGEYRKLKVYEIKKFYELYQHKFGKTKKNKGDE
jgi:23S rRNA pseudouridine2605 synthase